MSDLVTGDAVVLELRLAKLPSRALAFGIDVLVQLSALVLLLVLAATGVLSVDDQLGAVVVLVVIVATLVGYPVVFETLSRGRTLGKMALGLRVVRDDGGPVRFRHALTRGLAGFFVDFWGLGMFGAVAMIVSLISVKGKRVGDILAGTVVVRERVTGRDHGPPPMPPQLAAWAAGLELSALPDDLALTVRQFLVRFEEMHPDARETMGRGLAGDVAARLGQPPPLGVPAWAYLSAVLAERRARAERAALTAHPPGAYPTSAYPAGTYPTSAYPTGYPTGGYPPGPPSPPIGYPTSAYPTGDHPSSPPGGYPPGGQPSAWPTTVPPAPAAAFPAGSDDQATPPHGLPAAEPPTPPSGSRFAPPS